MPESSLDYGGRLVVFFAESPVVLFMFLAAVFSAIMTTSDSFLLAASQAYLTDIRQVPALQEPRKYTEESRDTAHRAGEDKSVATTEDMANGKHAELLLTARRATLIMGVLTVGTCYLLYVFKINFVGFLFVVFAAQISLAPAVITCLLRGKSEHQHSLQSMERKTFLSILAGYVLAALLLVGAIIMPMMEPSSGGSVQLFMLDLSPIWVTILSWTVFAAVPSTKVKKSSSEGA